MPYLYAQPQALADRVGIPEGDPRVALLFDILEGASRWVDKETGHRFYIYIPDPEATPLGEVRYFTAGDDAAIPWDSQRRGAGAQSIEIDECVAVSQVATDQDGDGVYETVWTVGTDYWLGPINAPSKGKPYTTLNRNAVSGRYIFPAWQNGIKTTGQFGYSTLANRPADIGLLCLMVGEVLAQPIMDLGMAGVQTYKLGQELTVTLKSEKLPDAAQRIIELYGVQSVVFA